MSGQIEADVAVVGSGIAGAMAALAAAAQGKCVAVLARGPVLSATLAHEVFHHHTFYGVSPSLE